ncbi:hypothetical protein H5410_023837 [Solanum commersonii]|uniref:Uncharacterized protein n=1 Tax=Solanum commersonii TaxID=4109 RepID=A0A9J5ZKA0_SOLCO|nr:hypothetical protein H5410_023837 [Solanum commersonii]
MGKTKNPLPTTEQQRNPGGHTVAPAIAGKATPKPSAASLLVVSWHYTEFSSTFIGCMVALSDIAFVIIHARAAVLICSIFCLNTDYGRHGS